MIFVFAAWILETLLKERINKWNALDLEYAVKFLIKKKKQKK